MSINKQPNDVDLYVGVCVREKRRENKWSQEKLADLLGLTFQQIQKYEKGVNRISAGRLFQIANLFKCSIESFFPENEYEIKRIVGMQHGLNKAEGLMSEALNIVKQCHKNSELTAGVINA